MTWPNVRTTVFSTEHSGVALSVCSVGFLSVKLLAFIALHGYALVFSLLFVHSSCFFSQDQFFHNAVWRYDGNK